MAQHLYPAMPYTYYTKVTRDDALAIRAYLNTVPAVQNAVKPTSCRFRSTFAPSMIGWNALFFSPGEFQPDRRQKSRSGIAALIWPKASGIAGCVTRRKIFWAVTRPPSDCGAMRYRAGLPPISPTTPAAALAPGRSTISPLI